jgi:hypothetical protein
MKKIILSLFTLFVFHFSGLADQLAYLSKADADRAANFLEKQKKVGMYCGCCDNDVLEPVKISGVEVKYTGYEQYYEVFIKYKSNGELKTVAVDLAYLWIKTKGVGLQTVGKALGLEHDPCNTPNW